jgi:hypothetical protein
MSAYENLHENLLVADFGQCFEHMRHYDESFRRTIEFFFGGMVVVIGASGALLQQYGFTSLTTMTVGFIFLFSCFSALLLLMSLARNRVYYAIVTRYVNELRGLYVRKAPEGFVNLTGMYTDPAYPKMFSPGSTQSIHIYFLLLCNALLLSAAIAAFRATIQLEHGDKPSVPWVFVTATACGAILMQLLAVLYYWHRKGKKKSADAAVFGVNK